MKSVTFLEEQSSMVTIWVYLNFILTFVAKFKYDFDMWWIAFNAKIENCVFSPLA